MPESGGTSVGTIYVDVVPRLSQQHLQRLNAQLGAAFGGGVGAGAPASGAAMSGGSGGADARMASAQAAMAAPGVMMNGVGMGGGLGGGMSASQAATSSAGAMYGGPGAAAVGGGMMGGGGPPPIPGSGGGDDGGGGGFFANRYGARRAFMAGMFGAHEVGRAYGSYLDSLSPINNRSPTQSMRSARTTVEKIGNGFWGSIIEGSMRFREHLIQQGGFVGAAAKYAPLGQAIDYFAGPMAYTKMDEADEAADQGQRDAAARVNRSAIGREGDRGADTFTRAASVLRTPGLHERRLAGITAKQSDAAQALRDSLKDKSDQISLIDDPRERARQVGELKAMESAGYRKLGAQAVLGWAETDEENRVFGIGMGQLRREGRAYQAGAAGNFGEAARRRFENSLDAKADAAQEESPAKGALQRSLNRGAMDEYNAYFQAQNTQDFFATRSLRNARYGRSGAAIYDVYAARQAEISGMDPRRQDDAEAHAREEYNSALSRDARAMGRDIQTGMDRRAITGIMADSRYTPATAGLMAQVETIRRTTLNRVSDANIAKNYMVAEDEQQSGINELTALKRRVLSGVSIENISGPLGTSAGENDQVTALLQKIVDAILNLGGGTGATAQ